MSSVDSRAAALRSGQSARQQRLQQSLVQSLADVLPRDREQRALKPEPARGAIPAARGTVQRSQPATGGGTAGIAGPLVEGATTPEGGAATDPVLDRTYHPVHVISSTDGLFSFEYQALAEITMRDANGSEVVVILADPEG